MIDQEWLLLHAGECKETAASCTDPNVAAKFAELARFYESLAAMPARNCSGWVTLVHRPEHNVLPSPPCRRERDCVGGRYLEVLIVVIRLFSYCSGGSR